MKKILATTLAFVLLSTVFFVSKVPVRAAEGTTTTTGKFLSASRSTPENVYNVKYETDNSNVSKTFGTAVKIISDVDQKSELYFADTTPVDGGKGMLMYAKTMDDGIATKPEIQIITDTVPAYSYYGKWYTLNKGDKEWKELNYSATLGGVLPSGFDGYIYIPFDAIFYAGDSTRPLNETSKVKGYSVYLTRDGKFNKGDFITFGQPIIVTSVTSDGIPNAKSINCDGTEYVYFALTTGKFLSASRSTPENVYNVKYETDNSNVSKTFGTAVKIISDVDQKSELYFADTTPVDGGKGMLMYAKTMDDGIATKPEIQIITDTVPAYSYYGKWYTLNKGDKEWKELNYSATLGGVLPSGFDGYIYIPFDAIFYAGDSTRPLNETSKVKGYSVYLTRDGKFNKGDFITFGQPIIVTSVTSDGIPNAEKIVCDDWAYYYFANIGDANGDKTTDIRDLVHLNSVLANLSEKTKNSDVNNDDVIDSFDLDALRKILLGISG